MKMNIEIHSVYCKYLYFQMKLLLTSYHGQDKIPGGASLQASGQCRDRSVIQRRRCSGYRQSQTRLLFWWWGMVDRVVESIGLV